jgi:hypothetical protein
LEQYRLLKAENASSFDLLKIAKFAANLSQAKTQN